MSLSALQSHQPPHTGQDLPAVLVLVSVKSVFESWMISLPWSDCRCIQLPVLRLSVLQTAVTNCLSAYHYVCAISQSDPATNRHVTWSSTLRGSVLISLRGSVMIVLPELNTDMQKLEEIFAGFALQLSGSSGEHSAAVCGRWEFSKRQRIGVSEVQLSEDE